MNKNEMIEWLHALRSACEDMELVRANFEDYRKPHHMIVRKLIHEVIGALEELPPVAPAEKVGHWIPVSERYPEDGQRVLVDYCDEDSGIMLIRFNINGYRGFKAWMPLPERYKASPTEAEGSE